MSTRPIHLLTPLLLTVVLGFSSVSHAQSQILFSCRIPTNLPQWQMLVDAFSEAFGALGYEFEMHYLNGKRETYELKNSDKYDGTCIRRRSFTEKADEYNMVLIDAVVGDPYTSVWRNRNVPVPAEPSRIFIEDANVGYLRGNTIAQEYLSQQGNINGVTFLRPDLGVKTLVSGRIDYCRLLPHRRIFGRTYGFSRRHRKSGRCAPGLLLSLPFAAAYSYQAAVRTRTEPRHEPSRQPDSISQLFTSDSLSLLN